MQALERRRAVLPFFRPDRGSPFAIALFSSPRRAVSQCHEANSPPMDVSSPTCRTNPASTKYTLPPSRRPAFEFPSPNGGCYQPRWRRDGKELPFSTGDNRLMSVDVTLSGTFNASAPKVLFQAPIYGGGASQQHRWDMSADGQRLLVNTAGGDVSAPLTLVENWTALLRK
jgi:hypothetical protein